MYWAKGGGVLGKRSRCTGQKEEVYWAKGGGVLGKTSHNGIIGGPDSERYYQRPTRLPAEGCGFRHRSFEEAGGCRQCLH